MHNVIGSGPRANTYGDTSSNLGIGNRLIITGNLNAFSHTNQAILPMPGEQFFTAHPRNHGDRDSPRGHAVDGHGSRPGSGPQPRRRMDCEDHTAQLRDWRTHPDGHV